MEARKKKIEVIKAATLKGHSDCVYIIDGEREGYSIYSGSGDGMIVKWDLRDPEDGRLVVKVETSVYAICLREDLKKLYIGQNFKGLHVIDIETQKEIASTSITSQAIFDIKSIGNKLIVASGEGQVAVLDIDDLSVLAKLNYASQSARTIAINEERKEFAVGYSDHFIRVFDLDSFQLKKEFQAHKNSVFKVLYLSDNRLMSSGRDAHINVWDLNDNYHQTRSIPGHMYAVNDIVLSPDGKYFATSSMDKTVKIWDTKNIQLLKVIDKVRFEGHTTSVNRLFWSNYHNLLVSCSDDRTLAVWDIKINGNSHENHAIRD